MRPVKKIAANGKNLHWRLLDAYFGLPCAIVEFFS